MNKLAKFFGRLILVCISWPLLSRAYGRLMRLRRPHFLVKGMIRRFQKHYHISMGEFQGQPEEYDSLAAFFLRPLDLQKRPLLRNENSLLSPADGRLSELELVAEDMATQVKGWSYPLSVLLGEAVDFSRGWYVATIYLSPSNYHRFHFPLSGRISGCFLGGTRLFPVNDFSVNRVDRLYLRNERAVTRFVLKEFTYYLVAVGATFVGSIGMKHLPAGLPQLGEWRPLDLAAEQMAEMGHFAMGSTIILALPAAMVENVVAEKGKPVKVGEPLFKIRS